MAIEITQIDPQLYLGSSEHPVKLTEEFIKVNPQVVINCASEISYQSRLFDIVHVPLKNDDYASLLDYLDDAVNIITGYLKKGKVVYVHCSDGVSRAPAIIIYFLMVFYSIDYEAAHKLLRKLRPVIEVNSNFERELTAIND